MWGRLRVVGLSIGSNRRCGGGDAEEEAESSCGMPRRLVSGGVVAESEHGLRLGAGCRIVCLYTRQKVLLVHR